MDVTHQPGGGSSWLLDKRINIAHILTTVMLLVAVMRWASVMETRLVQQEERLMAQQVMVNASQITAERQMDLIRNDINVVRNEIGRTNAKLDRLMEAQLGKFP